MKFGMSHYGHKSIPDAKFESDSSSSFGDMTSQNFPRKKGTSHEIRLFTPGNFSNAGFLIASQSEPFLPLVEVHNQVRF